MNEKARHTAPGASSAKPTPGPWYEAKTGNGQGLVVDERTGANVAVSYDKANARLIAAAPRMKDFLTSARSLWGFMKDDKRIPTDERLAAARKYLEVSALLAEVGGDE